MRKSHGVGKIAVHDEIRQCDVRNVFRSHTQGEIFVAVGDFAACNDADVVVEEHPMKSLYSIDGVQGARFEAQIRA